MNTVLTVAGLVDLSLLDVEDHIEVGDNYRKIATEYRLNGELVRRDVTVNALRGVMSEAREGNING